MANKGKIIVTGGLGYIGQPLVEGLLKSGWEVTVVDLGIFGGKTKAKLIKKDFRETKDSWFGNVKAIIHLAGVSNDPMADFDPLTTYAINTAGAVAFAQKAKKNGVKKFIFASTCSVYGYSAGKNMEEKDEVKPAFSYGISKLMAEKGIWCLNDKNFQPIILRKGTVSGPSIRMRFDLLLNMMVKFVISTGVITVCDPLVWRPIIDIRDIVSLYQKTLDFDKSGIYNICEGNYNVLKLAKICQKIMQKRGYSCRIKILNKKEIRNYRAENSLILKTGWQPKYKPEDTINNIVDGIERKKINVNSKNYLNFEVWKKWLARLKNY